MQYIEGLKEYTDTTRSAVTFGKFDGLHRGHQKLVERVNEFKEQEKVRSVLCTFDMSRRQILMTAQEKRIYLSGKLDYLVNCPFSDDFRHLSAGDFVDKVIKGVFHADYVVIGTDFQFGYGKEGDAGFLKEHEEQYGYQTVVVDKERYHGREISSTYIKEVVQEGDVELAFVLLGYHYGVTGIVEHGKALGRNLGFPTFNVEWPREKMIPQRGVYVSRSLVDGVWYGGISNIGVKPTVSAEGRVLIESYLFGYEGDAYGKTVYTELLKFCRPEQKFRSVEEMRIYINRDIAYGRSYFEG